MEAGEVDKKPVLTRKPLSWDELYKLYLYIEQLVLDYKVANMFDDQKCLITTMKQIALRQRLGASYWGTSQMPQYYKREISVYHCYYQIVGQFGFGCGPKDQKPRPRAITPELFNDKLVAQLAEGGQSEDDGWHKARANLAVTGSKAYCCAGYDSPYSDALIEFAIAMGYIMDPFVSSYVIQRGIYCEDIVRVAYERYITDEVKNMPKYIGKSVSVRIEKRGILVPKKKELRFFGSSPDGRICVDVNGEKSYSSLEIKVGKLYDSMPAHWYAQAQTEMLLEEVDVGHFVFSKVAGKGKPYKLVALRRTVLRKDWNYLTVLCARKFVFVACVKHNVPPFAELYMKCGNIARPPDFTTKNTRDIVF
jgi:hypothetical protein